MSALAHYFEDAGLTTVIVALIREHIIAMQPPRALWVSFELGRPFGAPNDASLQSRILRAALALLDHSGPEPLLQEFPATAPHPDGELDWQFPGSVDPSNLQAEIQSIHHYWLEARERHGHSRVGISGLPPSQALEFIETFHADEPMANPKGMSRIARARFAIDDIKAYYLEAATARSGHPASFQLHEWFWEQTLAGALLRDFQERARCSDDKNLKLIATSLVPAERTISWRG